MAARSASITKKLGRGATETQRLIILGLAEDYKLRAFHIIKKCQPNLPDHEIMEMVASLLEDKKEKTVLNNYIQQKYRELDVQLIVDSVVEEVVENVVQEVSKEFLKSNSWKKQFTINLAAGAAASALISSIAFIYAIFVHT